MLLSDLEKSINSLLQITEFDDYAYNGLQVAGKPYVKKVVGGVTASLRLIQEAIQVKADAIVVHHGLFWKKQSPVITGWIKNRLDLLIKHDINLLAYHLPLDAHPIYGNNAQLASLLGWKVTGHFGRDNLGHLGVFKDNTFTHDELTTHLTQKLHRSPLVILPEVTRDIKLLSWCSGGAQSYFEEAIQAQADVFITGEISEPEVHLARECQVAYFACGHHATECGGVSALGGWLEQTLGVTFQFIDIPNPV
ncbi:MAG: Nif3-like dinuclear metal center hexameric protein [Gammaproteobacteria bacterium]|nr:Nif3-like dinuclear metal center hexameric protein [Gammaproteobacteria bacterium]